MKPYNQARHFKDPDLGKVSKNISMTDAQYKNLGKAAKISCLHIGEFIAMQVDWFLMLHELRQLEKNFEGRPPSKF